MRDTIHRWSGAGWALGVLLLMVGVLPDAHAQFFAAPGIECGTGAGTTVDPGCLQEGFDALNAQAVTDLALVAGAYLAGQDFINPVTLHEDAHFHSWDGEDPGTLDDGASVITLRGAVEVLVGDFAETPPTPVRLTLSAGLTLAFDGEAHLTFADQGSVDGAGTLAFTSDGEAPVALIEVPENPDGLTIQNLRLDRPDGEVLFSRALNVPDQAPASLTITNRLELHAGVLDMTGEELLLSLDVDRDNDPVAAFEIRQGAVLTGTKTATLTLTDSDEATPDPFATTGTGALQLALDFRSSAADDGDPLTPNTLFTFSEIGGVEPSVLGGAASADLDPAVQFDNLTRLVGTLTVQGTTPPAVSANSSTKDRTFNGKQAGGTQVAFSEALTFTGDLHLLGGDLILSGFSAIEGDLFADAGRLYLSSETLGPAVGQTVVEGRLLSDGGDPALLALTQNGEGGTHNLAVQGNIDVEVSPLFMLDNPADASPAAVLPLPAFCTDGTQQALGNKFLLIGEEDQTLTFGTDFIVGSLAIFKERTGDDIEIDKASASLVVATSLELLRGTFKTNGLLDAEGTATVVVNRETDGGGVLEAGDASGAYRTTEAGDIPAKVKYTGTVELSTRDELPGPPEGSNAGTEIVLDRLEVAMCAGPGQSFRPPIRLGKAITITESLRLTFGHLDVSSAVLTLGNEVQVALGNGGLIQEGVPPFQGGVVFPTEDTASAFTLGEAFTIGEDGIDLLFFGTSNQTVFLAWPDVGTGEPDEQAEVIRDVRVDLTAGTSTGPAVRLRSGETFHLGGNLIVTAGVFDLNGSDLVVQATNGNDTHLIVGQRGALTNAANAPSGAAVHVLEEAVETYLQAPGTRTAPVVEALQAYREHQHTHKRPAPDGTLRFVGEDDTDIRVETTESRLRFELPAIEIDKEGHVTFDASGLVATTIPPAAPNRRDEIGVPSFTLVQAAPGDGVRLLGGLDRLEVVRTFIQCGNDPATCDAGFAMTGQTSTGAGAQQPTRQSMVVGDAFRQMNGSFLTNGASITVLGDFRLGVFDEDAGQPSDAAWEGASGSTLTVLGDFRVAPDTDPTDQVSADPSTRNRYVQGGGALFLFGDYDMRGTGDAFDNARLISAEQGLRGITFFVGTEPQDVFHRQDEDAYFNAVIVDSEGGLRLQETMWLNASTAELNVRTMTIPGGVLQLSRGFIDTQGSTFAVHVLNRGSENALFDRNAAPANGTVLPGFGEAESVVALGSDVGFVEGPVQRVVEAGNTTGDDITGGYLFPVGTQVEGVGGVFRPLIVQFSDDLLQAATVRSAYAPQIRREDVVFGPGPFVDEEGSSLVLDVLSDQFWVLEMDHVPVLRPNIRVAASGLPNVFDVKQLRLLQWDCVFDGEGRVIAGQNPRLAGTFSSEDAEGRSAVFTDIIAGVPNVTHEHVSVETCQVLGLASNRLYNPLDLPDTGGGAAQVQILHNAPYGAVDLYVDETRLLDDLAFQGATSFVRLPAGTTLLHVTDADAPDATASLLSSEIVLEEDGVYILLLQGADALRLDKVSSVRLVAEDPEQVEFFFVHGSLSQPEPLDMRLLDPFNNNEPFLTLADDLPFLAWSGYQGVAPDDYNIEVSTADNTEQIEVFRFELNDLAGKTLTLVLSDAETLTAKAASLTLYGVDVDGTILLPDIVTANEVETEVPGLFDLKGTYPNPFNPTTTIVFDLPEPAEVSVEVIDLLGRRVLVVPPRALEAGINRTVRLDAQSLASGIYLYRVLARTAAGLSTASGRMTLLK